MRAAAKDDVLAVIVSALTPYVGAAMARASARALCQKLGFAGPNLAPRDIERLVDALGPGLHVFIGREKTKVVLGAIREDLTTLGGLR